MQSQQTNMPAQQGGMQQRYNQQPTQGGMQQPQQTGAQQGYSQQPSQQTGTYQPQAGSSGMQQQPQLNTQMQNQTGLVAVNLNSIRFDIARNLSVDAERVPISISLPISVAANVCGVDVNALASQGQQSGGQQPSCNASNAQLASQHVQNVM